MCPAKESVLTRQGGRGGGGGGVRVRPGRGRGTINPRIRQCGLDSARPSGTIRHVCVCVCVCVCEGARELREILVRALRERTHAQDGARMRRQVGGGKVGGCVRACVCARALKSVWRL